VGLNLSAVQQAAAEICLIIEDQERARDRGERLKDALVAFSPETFMPAFFSDDVSKKDPMEPDERIMWHTPGDVPEEVKSQEHAWTEEDFLRYQEQLRRGRIEGEVTP
jgi:hypothetical protein